MRNFPSNSLRRWFYSFLRCYTISCLDQLLPPKPDPWYHVVVRFWVLGIWFHFFSSHDKNTCPMFVVESFLIFHWNPRMDQFIYAGWRITKWSLFTFVKKFTIIIFYSNIFSAITFKKFDDDGFMTQKQRNEYYFWYINSFLKPFFF